MAADTTDTGAATVDSVAVEDAVIVADTDASPAEDTTDAAQTGEDTSDAGDIAAQATPATEGPEGPSGMAGDDTLAAPDDASDETPDGARDDTASPDDTMPDPVAGDATGDSPARDTPPPTPMPPPPPAPPQRQERQGGFVPLVLGGVIAAGIGYGAAYMGWLPTMAGDDDQATAIASALQGQSDTLAALQAQVAELAAATPDAPEVDLSPVLDQIAGLATRIDGTTSGLETLAARVTTLEDRPVFSGDINTDTAAALETATRLEVELEAERAAAAARAADLAAEAEAAATAAAEAEADAAAAIAEAQAEAQAAMARAEAEAALGQVQVALETGAPFAEPLAALAAVTDVPEGLAAAADTGVPSLDALQSAFPALARAALPRALQETAGEDLTDRLGAFVMGQIGGRSVEPRDGDDPDAVLSRIEAAVRSGDLATALTEIAALPEGAQAELAPWVADIEARAGAVAGLDALSAALAASAN